MKQKKHIDFHEPVLLDEVVNGLNVQTGRWYVDATLGGGGHTKEILRRGGHVIAIDQDADAIFYVQERLKYEINEGKLKLIRDNFIHIRKIVKEAAIVKIYGVVFDLGVSTHQIKNSGRGFTFREPEQLDMRMSADSPQTAYEVVNSYSEEELYEIFRKFGEERLARQIARSLVRARSVKEIQTTQELSELVEDVYQRAGRNTKKIHAATKIFQAIRIAVNDELNTMRQGLSEAATLLEKDGRLIVISFHSLEDRIVKQYFRRLEQEGSGTIITKKPVVASIEDADTTHLLEAQS